VSLFLSLHVFRSRKAVSAAFPVGGRPAQVTTVLAPVKRSDAQGPVVPAFLRSLVAWALCLVPLPLSTEQSAAPPRPMPCGCLLGAALTCSTSTCGGAHCKCGAFRPTIRSPAWQPSTTERVSFVVTVGGLFEFDTRTGKTTALWLLPQNGSGQPPTAAEPALRYASGAAVDGALLFCDFNGFGVARLKGIQL
jgi:hypothetical protein